MRNYVKIIFIPFIFIISCKQNYQNEALCEVLRLYMKENKIDSNTLIISEFIKLNAWDPELELNIVDQDTFYIQEPPPMHSNFETISREALRILAINKVIDSSEIDYLFTQAKNIPKSNFRCTDLNCRLISSEKLDNVRSNLDVDEFFNRLEKDYKVRSYIEFSQPLFTRDNQTVIFCSNRYCGS